MNEYKGNLWLIICFGHIELSVEVEDILQRIFHLGVFVSIDVVDWSRVSRI